MPKIATYDAPQGIGLHPTETGISATAAAARRVQGEYNEAAAAIAGTGQRFGSAIEAAGSAAVKYLEHREVSVGATELAKLQDNFSKEWNETAKAADPNDQSVAPKFLEQRLEPALEQFKQGFNTEGGQRFAESHVQRFREHMFHTTSSDMAQLAGVAVHNNTIETINRLGNMVYRDPSSLGLARDTLNGTAEGLTGSSPNLTATQAAKVKSEVTEKGLKQIVRGAVMGAIAKGADWEKIANDPKNAPYIDVAEVSMFARAAKAQDRADRLTQKQIETYQHQQNVQAAHKEANRIMTDNVTFDPATNRAVIKPDYFKQALDIARNNPDAPDGLVRTMLDWGERQQNMKDQPTHSDPVVKQNLIDGMFRTDKPTTEVDILRAGVDKKLSAADLPGVHQLWAALEQHPLKEPIMHETLNGVKHLLGTDPVGTGKYASFVQDFVPQYLDAKKNKNLPTNALDLKDPKSMISQAMKPYQRDIGQIMMDKAARGLFNVGEDGLPLDVQTPSPPQAMPRINSKEQYDKLKPGTTFIGQDGKRYRKPEQ